jgi:hypothetical protein
MTVLAEVLTLELWLKGVADWQDKKKNGVVLATGLDSREKNLPSQLISIRPYFVLSFVAQWC